MTLDEFKQEVSESVDRVIERIHEEPDQSEFRQAWLQGYKDALCNIDNLLMEVGE